MDISKYIFVLYRVGHITSTKLWNTDWYNTTKDSKFNFNSYCLIEISA